MTRYKWLVLRPLETGKRESLALIPLVDQVRVCRPVNISFSAMALNSVAPFLKDSNSILNAISRKCETIQRAGFRPAAFGRVQERSAAASGNISERCESRRVREKSAAAAEKHQ